MQAYLRAQRSWLTVERLPGYAPDLNPAELVWGNVKGGELANLCADNLGEVEQELRAGLRRVRRSPRWCSRFSDTRVFLFDPSCHCIMRDSVRGPNSKSGDSTR